MDGARAACAVACGLDAALGSVKRAGGRARGAGGPLKRHGTGRQRVAEVVAELGGGLDARAGRPGSRMAEDEREVLVRQQRGEEVGDELEPVRLTEVR